MEGIFYDTLKKRPTDQLLLTELMETYRGMNGRGKWRKELTGTAMFFLAKDCLPLCTVEKPGFKKFVVTLVIADHTFSRTALPELHIYSSE